MENTSKKLSFKHYLIIASMLFGMFFGAGNLIFPIHLGQLAGSHWITAGIGFLLTGTYYLYLQLLRLPLPIVMGFMILPNQSANVTRPSSW